jgi:hypothetical protein
MQKKTEISRTSKKNFIEISRASKKNFTGIVKTRQGKRTL